MTHPGYEYPDLGHLFRAFFHEDWPEEYPPGADWPDVIEEYLEDTPCSRLSEAVDQLDRLLAAGYTDQELERIVDQLGSRSSFADPTYTAALTAIRDRVQRYIDTHPDDEVPPERETTGA